ncbi:MAG TPA: response regulator transcription factor [Ktedonobacteraceae bacterium]|nr:response regulator transcription factor [Ktedonobacteraceae bacterium]
MAQRIRIMIVDDQTLVREGLRKLLELEPDFEVAAMAADGEAALTLVERLYAQSTPPDVILMDIRMPRVDGIAATRAIKHRWPDTHIVILTTFDDTELIHAGLHAGALGYSLKDITSEELAMTVRTAARGQVLLQPDIASKVFSALAPARPSPPAQNFSAGSASTPTYIDPATSIEQLTEREREILALVARGASNRQIAENLYLTEGTVKNHMSNILSKLGVRDRTQAAIKAKELGL